MKQQKIPQGMNDENDEKNDIITTKLKEDKKMIEMIDKNDATILSYLGRLYNVINSDKVDFGKIKNAVDALAIFNQRQEYNYLDNLLHPEKCKGVKIPTPIPVPSCSFQLHNCVTLSTNNSGNLGVLFNPFFLYSANVSDKEYDVNGISDDKAHVKYLTSMFVLNHNSANGHSPNANWVPVDIGQGIPNVYDQFRLVSASIVFKYIGRLDIASGVIGGAIVFDENPAVGGVVNFNSSQAADIPIIPLGLRKYGNFDLAMDSFYHQENMSLEGIRELYFPIDNSFEEYMKTDITNQLEFTINAESQYSSSVVGSVPQDYYKSGFNQLIYVLGAPPSSACFKVDIYCNFECLPNPEFLNYLPLSMNPRGVSTEEKRQANLIVQQKPIMKIAESDSVSLTVMPSIWKKMETKFGNSLPGVGKLLSRGLINSMPGLKPGIALASAMINMNDDNDIEMSK